MMTSIVRHEFFGTLRDGRFRSIAAIITVLLAAALVAGWSYQRDLARQRTDASRSEQARWIGQPEKNPHSAAHYGVYAFKPRLAPALFDPGIEPYTGVAIWLESHYQNDPLHRPAEDATAAQRFGDMTVALVLQLLLPLLIIVVGFGAVSGEREHGTLRQIAALGLKPSRWLIGKAVGLASAIGLLALPALIVCGLILSKVQGVSSEATWMRFSLLAAVYFAYLATFLFFTLSVSAFIRSSRASLVVLLGIWMLNGLLVPRALAELAAKRHPLPSAASVKSELGQRLGDPHGRSSEVDVMEKELMQQFGVSRAEDLPINRSGLSLQAGEVAGNRIFDEVIGGLHDCIDAQNRFQRNAAWLTPLAALQPISLALAGTDFTHHRAFMDAAEQHRRFMQRELNGDLMLNGPRDNSTYLAKRDLWARIPAFEFQAPALSAVSRTQLIPLFALTAWLVGALLAFAFVARRLNPL